MSLVFASDGSISATFGRSGIVGDAGTGAFTDIYDFTIPANGLASGSITTNTTFVGDVTDLDFVSVFFNGIKLTGTVGGQNEVLFATAVPILAGAANEIIINGIARGNGAYGAQGTFVPSPSVPEPATWAMLVAGFGAVGYSLRSRKTRFAQAV